MFKYFYFSLILLVNILIMSCESRPRGKVHDLSISTSAYLPLVFEMNTSIEDGFGIPIPSVSTHIYKCLNDLDSNDRDSSRFFIGKNGDQVSIRVLNSNTMIKVNYIIPDLFEIRYEYSGSVNGRIIPDTIFPFKVCNPIKSGLWEIKNDSFQESINYDVNLDYSRLNKFCHDDFQAYSFSFGKIINDVTGFPVDLKNVSELSLCFNKNDEFIYESEDIKIVINREDKLLKFDLHIFEKNEKVKGGFLIPNYKSVVYQKEYDIEYGYPQKISPFYVFEPIRTGEWVVERDGETEEFIYDYVIDYSRLENWCGN